MNPSLPSLLSLAALLLLPPLLLHFSNRWKNRKTFFQPLGKGVCPHFDGVCPHSAPPPAGSVPNSNGVCPQNGVCPLFSSLLATGVCPHFSFLATGLAANLLTALLLLSLSLWTLPRHICLLLLASLLLPLLFSQKSPASPPSPKSPLPSSFFLLTSSFPKAALFLLLLTAALPHLPPPSEWLAGGWDPGIYTNNALAIARTGTLRPLPSPFYFALPPNLLPLFSERTLGTDPKTSPTPKSPSPQVAKSSSLPPAPYREILPGVPLAPDGSHPLFFFHLTPIFGALLARLGGLPLLFRANAVLALVVLFQLAGFVSRLFPGRRILPLLAPLLALLSPPFWYLLNIPTSEFLYLFLLLAAANAWLDARAAARSLSPLLLAALFLMPVNHLNTVVLVSALVAFAALLERLAPRPGAKPRILSALAALALGALWDAFFARATLLKLLREGSDLHVVLAASLAAALLAAALLLLPLPLSRLRRPAALFLRTAALLLALALAALALASLFPAARDFVQTLYKHPRLPVLGVAAWWTMRLAPLASVPMVLWAAAGLLVLALRRRPPLPLVAATVAFLSILLLTLAMPGIARLLPWALRRFFPFALPAFLLLQLAALHPLTGDAGSSPADAGGAGGSPAEPLPSPASRWSRVSRTLLLCLLSPLLLLPARQCLRAARATDYPGLAAALESLRPHLRPTDLVVADSPVFATPLALALGHDVVNGRLLQSGSDPAKRAARLDAIRRHAPGRILLLTSDPDGPALFPDPIPSLFSSTPLLDLPLDLQTVIHASRQSAYETRHTPRRLRLYPPAP